MYLKRSCVTPNNGICERIVLALFSQLKLVKKTHPVRRINRRKF
ncbi:hypothetical protein OL548_27875 [Lysinibacillus sp. MHQ-1]|nr:hypothetical protein OL548_27875 [Lysinibacillus sp. MHQ-1]